MTAKATPLAELATIVRSKNAGPFRLTFDIMLPDVKTFERVRRSAVLTRENVAKLLGIAPGNVTSIFELEAARAFKVTIKRPRGQCDIGESDVYGAQQHVPFMGLLIPADA